ncbi:MAG TPA: toll/interleukin-1 receptor domain-containing protein [Verrucomicrobiae bacterium]|nr:toll/interleukin-1 receptor domain-containing protein [Verrucomicrobiae bacterium]
MNGSTTIKVLHDRVLPKTRPAVDYELDYEYVPTNLVGEPEERSQTKRGRVRIGITLTVIAVWQLRNDEEILRVLYQHAKREIERRAREGDLGADSVIELESSTAPKKSPYDPARVVREFEKPFNVEILNPDKAPLSSVIFICHAEVDKPIATALKTYFEKSNHGVEVFQASHPASLPGGHEWWNGIRDALNRATVVLTLYSERSKERPWLYFESGGGHFRGALVIPLVVPPERRSIPPPLGVLQARDLASKEDVAALVKEVGRRLDVTFLGSSEGLWTFLQDAAAAAAAAGGTRQEGISTMAAGAQMSAAKKSRKEPPLEFAGLKWEALPMVLRRPDGDPKANAVTGPLCPNCLLDLSGVGANEIHPPVKKGDVFRFSCPTCKTEVGNIDAAAFHAVPDMGPGTLPLDLDKLRIRVFEEAKAQRRRKTAT